MKYAWLLGLSLFGICACEEVTGPAGYVVTVDDAAGLRPGGPVYVAGVKVGRIKSVELKGGKAEVELLVEGQHDVELTDKACVSIGRYAFDPETHLTLEPSKAGAPLDTGGQITCVRDADELSARMDRVSAAAIELLDTALNGKGTVGRLLKDEKLADQVVTFFETGADEGREAPPAETDESDETSDAENDADSPPPAKTPPKAAPAKRPGTNPPPKAPPAKAPPPAPPPVKDPF